ncbi:Alpha/Beta hydrolase protein [Aspergillus recurvatus]
MRAVQPLHILPFAVGLASAALYDTVIQTKYGAVQGYPAFNSTPSVDNLTNWKNITNRWKAPQPASAWNGTLNAKEFGNVCPSTTQGFNNYTIDKDCLNLNIWSTANSSDAKLPVVMWSYPALSTAADNLFNGAGMADKGIVYVNYNYRMGAFGWLSHPKLSEEFEQFTVLKWIHENIAAFGGDPDHITVMGQSAGSAATQHILNSPLTKGLIGVRLFKALNVLSIAEAREVSYGTIVNIADTTTFGSSSSGESWSFSATLDYYAMLDTYYNTLVKGLAQDMPVITGNTKDESGATFNLMLSLADYLLDMNSTFLGEWLEWFLEAYAANSLMLAPDAYNSQWTDRSKDQGAYHESKINYVLNNLFDTNLPWTATDYQIANKLNSYWVNFIKTSNPNSVDTDGQALVHWAPTTTTETVQHVGNGWGAIPLAPKDKVKLFQEWFKIQPLY